MAPNRSKKTSGCYFGFRDWLVAGNKLTAQVNFAIEETEGGIGKLLHRNFIFFQGVNTVYSGLQQFTQNEHRTHLGLLWELLYFLMPLLSVSSVDTRDPLVFLSPSLRHTPPGAVPHILPQPSLKGYTCNMRNPARQRQIVMEILTMTCYTPSEHFEMV